MMQTSCLTQEYITVVPEELEDTKGVIRIRISKNIDNTMDKRKSTKPTYIYQAQHQARQAMETEVITKGPSGMSSKYFLTASVV